MSMVPISAPSQTIVDKDTSDEVSLTLRTFNGSREIN